MVVLDSVKQAHERIRPYATLTPLEENRILSLLLGTNVYLKMEIFQKTGSFKFRGALNKLLKLSDQEHARGVVAVSGGNHAQGVAFAASLLGVRALILMPQYTPKSYVEATRAYGADVILFPGMTDAFAGVCHYVQEGMNYVHPYDDPDVIAGQGTVGLEILSQLPEVTDVVVSIGGGGLIAGMGVALKSLKSDVRIWGVETQGADSMSQALAAGRVVRLPRVSSIAYTLGAPEVSEQTLELTRRHTETVTVVSDDQALGALGFLLECAKVLTEPAAACTLSAALHLRDHFRSDSHVVLVLCGGNFPLSELERWGHRIHAQRKSLFARATDLSGLLGSQTKSS
jgi:threonine dehydratase